MLRQNYYAMKHGNLNALKWKRLKIEDNTVCIILKISILFRKYNTCMVFNSSHFYVCKKA